MGTACEEGFCDCKFHKPNQKHPLECDCFDCRTDRAAKIAAVGTDDPLVVWVTDTLYQGVNSEIQAEIVKDFTGSVESDNKTITTLNDYQRFAGVTANKKLDGKLNLAVLGLGIAGEAGEVADIIKKHVGHDHDLDLDKTIKEIGDVLWYAAVLSNALGVSLQTVAQRNIDKLRERYPEGFSVAASKNRKQGDV
jgi:NTP pyrophosphatase (non-canonical NTP hydrolase)